MGPCPQKRISSRSVSLLGSTPTPPLTFSKSADGPDVLKEALPKRDSNLELSFEEKDPRFTRLKSDLALRLLSKGLFYTRAMG